MTLVSSFEKSGNYLFKYRGQIPVVLFLLAIPAIALNPVYNRHFTNAIDYIAALVSAIGFFIRAYTVGTTIEGTSGRNTQNQVAEQLNSKGIYSIVRHPLYLGNYLIWIGIVLFTLNIWFVIIVSLLYWIYYERIMIAEEAFLEKKFGE
ncbi:MAG: isoprenylcysteine carboxylmethyltransferase family protein, partial [Bacteroidia bacterium]